MTQEESDQSKSDPSVDRDVWSIVKEFRFEAAHRLENHNGKCRRLHGHSYKLEIELARNHLLDNPEAKGMVIDFADVSRIVESQVVDIWDHRFLATDETPVVLLQALGHIEVARLDIPASTAEYIAALVGGILLGTGSMMKDTLRSVTVWETVNSKATWHRY
ncbi:hypothetical protein LCGC14_1366680 [marine sediment metagenome]|uniref:6-pyruvoyl tetrahydrobiopterin synthase n=1 Tax=marine sediment metagenome TaxID=412755 RepID=A0A0F9K6L8_9ZZZZ